jgi:hypothetical protein
LHCPSNCVWGYFVFNRRFKKLTLRPVLETAKGDFNSMASKCRKKYQVNDSGIRSNLGSQLPPGWERGDLSFQEAKLKSKNYDQSLKRRVPRC